MSDPAQLDGTSRESLLAEIADEFVQRIGRGEQPDVEEYAGRHPQMADVLRHVLPALELMRFPPRDSETGADLSDERQGTGRLGDYRILREIGRGGMGVVYEAEQVSLARRVALKVLPFAAVLDQRQLKRFKNEAQAAAGLHHANIVPVYGVGCERGVHYYAMQYIEGQTLAEVIRHLRGLEGFEGEGGKRKAESGERGEQAASELADSLASGRFAPAKETSDPEAPMVAYAQDQTPGATAETKRTPQAAISTERSTKSPAYFRGVARLGIQVAEALDHAHEEGVVHRDVKPSNLILDAGGKVWVTDFGLARVEADPGLTMTGDVLGTLRYMSPEQALARRAVVDHRTDVYSLGVTLYELLTLQPAFPGKDRPELLRRITSEEPPSPRRINRAIPPELETIVLKAMAKDPAERYATARDLADDVERFLDDRPIRARRPSPIQRMAKWARRHRRFVASLSGVLLMYMLGISIAALLVYQERNQANRRADELQRRNYFHLIALAQNALENEAIRQVDQLLNRCPAELRGWEWHRLRRLMDGSRRPLPGHAGRVWAVCYDPSGEQIASASWDKTVKIWDAGAGRELYSLVGHTDWVYAVAYDPQGKLLASGSKDGTIRVWDAATGKPLRTLRGHEGAVRAVAFSPDGERIASGGLDFSIRIWNPKTGEEIRRWVAHSHPRGELTLSDGVQSLAFTPDGKSIVSGGVDRTVKQWDVETGELLRSFVDDQLVEEAGQPWSHGHVVVSVDVSLEGGRIASGGNGGVIKVWNAATGKLQWASPPQVMQVGSVAFSPDGKQVVSGDASGACRVWDAESGEARYVLLGHLAPCASARFSPDGTQIVSGDWQYEIKLWDARPVPRTRNLRGHIGFVHAVAFHPNGKTVVSASYDRTVKVWDLITGEARTMEHDAAVFGVAIDPRGKRIASCDGDGKIRIWDSDTLALLQTLPRDGKPEHVGRVNGVAFLPDGERIATCGEDATIRIWDLPAGRERVRLTGHTAAVRAVGLGPRGRRLVSGSADGTVKVWDLADGRVLETLLGHSGEVAGVAYSPDGTRIVSCTPLDKSLMPGETILWDGETRRQLAVIDDYAPRHAPVFSPDGSRIVIAGYDGRLLLLDAVTGEEALWLRGHQGELVCAAVSADGRMIASGGREQAVKIWEIDPPE